MFFPYLIDDFLIQYSQNLKKKDFITKIETQSRRKQRKREYLNEPKTRDLMAQLNRYFESKFEIPRIKHGDRPLRL